MLENHKGVAVALPFSNDGIIEVWADKAGALDKDAAQLLVEGDPELTLLSFEKRPAKPAVKKSPETGTKPEKSKKKKKTQ